jgi:hypothetical protein
MAAGGSYVSGCTDLKGWKDSIGAGCGQYLKEGTCRNGQFSAGKQATTACDYANADNVDASVRRGAWARVTVDRFKHSALQTF